MIAVIVDIEDLGKVVIAALIAGVGVTTVFSLALHGAVKFIDNRRDGRPLEAAFYAVLGGLCLTASLASVVMGIVVMTQ